MPKIEFTIDENELTPVRYEGGLEFHEQVDEILARHAFGYDQALEVLEMAGRLADEGIFVERVLVQFLRSIQRHDLADSLGISDDA